MHFPVLLLCLSTLIADVVGVPLSTRNAATKNGDALVSVLERISTGIVRVDAEVSMLNLSTMSVNVLYPFKAAPKKSRRPIPRVLNLQINDFLQFLPFEPSLNFHASSSYLFVQPENQLDRSYSASIMANFPNSECLKLIHIDPQIET